MHEEQRMNGVILRISSFYRSTVSLAPFTQNGISGTEHMMAELSFLKKHQIYHHELKRVTMSTRKKMKIPPEQKGVKKNEKNNDYAYSTS